METHPKCPVAIDSDDKVDNINEEHDGVHVTHGAVFRMDDVVEKLSNGQVNVKGTGKESHVRHSSLLLKHASCYHFAVCLVSPRVRH